MSEMDVTEELNLDSLNSHQIPLLENLDQENYDRIPVVLYEGPLEIVNASQAKQDFNSDAVNADGDHKQSGEMIGQSSTQGLKTKGKVKNKGAKNAKVRKMPITARGFFLMEKKKELVNTTGGSLKMKEVGEEWKNMSKEEKQRYVDLSEKDKLELGENYRKDMSKRNKKGKKEVTDRKEEKKVYRAKKVEEDKANASVIAEVGSSNKKLVLNNEMLVKTNEELTKLLKDETSKREKLMSEMKTLQISMKNQNQELNSIKEKFKSMKALYGNLKLKVSECENCSNAKLNI